MHTFEKTNIKFEIQPSTDGLPDLPQGDDSLTNVKERASDPSPYNRGRQTSHKEAKRGRL